MHNAPHDVTCLASSCVPCLHLTVISIERGANTIVLLGWSRARQSCAHVFPRCVSQASANYSRLAFSSSHSISHLQRNIDKMFQLQRRTHRSLARTRWARTSMVTQYKAIKMILKHQTAVALCSVNIFGHAERRERADAGDARPSRSEATTRAFHTHAREQMTHSREALGVKTSDGSMLNIIHCNISTKSMKYKG